MGIDEALWKLERLQVCELVAKGSEVGIVRKLTRPDGTVAHLVHVFSLAEKGQFSGVEGGIWTTKLTPRIRVVYVPQNVLFVGQREASSSSNKSTTRVRREGSQNFFRVRATISIRHFS